MPLTILSVAYPLAPVRPDTAGGAEQVLGMLDEALTRAGHSSVVVAQAGSRVAGKLAAFPAVSGILDDAARTQAHQYCRAAIADALARWPVDVVHVHGHDFPAYLPPSGLPALVTLHVPREWYGTEVVQITRPNTWRHCVSEAQRRTWPDEAPLLATIPNGVPLENFGAHVSKRGFALGLGRISPEKGFHVALDAAAEARMPFVLAGEVYRYADHERYFHTQIAPRLHNRHAHFIGTVGGTRKRRLLAAAQCLLIPSQVPETSSLVAMEALASGTPVVAYPAGALAEIVEHGTTGLLVRSESEMAEAIHACRGLNPSGCRQAARERFSAARMFQDYLRIYERLSGRI